MSEGIGIKTVLSNLWRGIIKSEEALEQLNDLQYGFDIEESALLGLLDLVFSKEMSIEEFLQEAGFSFNGKTYNT